MTIPVATWQCFLLSPAGVQEILEEIDADRASESRIEREEAQALMNS